jgi:hypothetical protein
LGISGYSSASEQTDGTYTLTGTGGLATGGGVDGNGGQAGTDFTGGFRYHADADDHWQRTPATYANF